MEHSGTYICEAVGVPPNTPRAQVSVHLTVEPCEYQLYLKFLPKCIHLCDIPPPLIVNLWDYQKNLSIFRVKKKPEQRKVVSVKGKEEVGSE